MPWQKLVGAGVQQREVFSCLPSFCKSDLLEGAWWSVWASMLGIPIACIPLADIYLNFWSKPPETVLTIFAEDATWGLLIYASLVFTIGSLVLVRAFGPVRKPLLPCIGSDEALCAWLYFLGTIVAPFYCLVFVISEPTVILHWAAMILSALAAVAMCYFIVQAYHRPHPEHPAGTSTPCCKSLVVTCWGSTSCCVKHVATNQLAVSWAFFLLSLLFLVVGFAFCFTSQNQLQAFVFISGTVDSVLWTISSAYFVAGSYVVDGATDKTSNNNNNINISIMNNDYSNNNNNDNKDNNNNNDNNNDNNNNNNPNPSKVDETVQFHTQRNLDMETES